MSVGRKCRILSHILDRRSTPSEMFSSIFTTVCGIIYLWLPHVRISVKAFLKRICGGKNELDLLEENDFFDIMEARKSDVRFVRDD